MDSANPPGLLTRKPSLPAVSRHAGPQRPPPTFKGEDMSLSRKILKIVSLLMILSGISYLILDVIFVAIGMVDGSSALYDDLTVGQAAVLLIILSTVIGIEYLVMGVLGLRGANVPSKIGPFRVLAIIGLALAIIDIVVYVAFGDFAAMDINSVIDKLIGLALNIVGLILANNVKKEAERI